MPAVMDAEQRRKLEDALMHKAQDLIRQMRANAELGNPERVDAQALMLAEILKTREFPSQRATEFRELAKSVQRAAYQLSVNTLLHQAEQRAHAGDDKGRNEILTRAKAHFGMSIRFGADDEFRHGVERRVQAALMTTAEGVDERTKKAAARRLEQHDTGPKPPGGIERRRAIRYMDPPLTVDLGGAHYRTTNWSLRGLLLENYRGEPGLSVGDKVKLDVHCDELPSIPPGRQIARVVRVDQDRLALALDFGDMSTVVIELVHAMRDAGMKPEAER